MKAYVDAAKRPVPLFASNAYPTQERRKNMSLMIDDALNNTSIVVCLE